MAAPHLRLLAAVAMTATMLLGACSRESTGFASHAPRSTPAQAELARFSPQVAAPHGASTPKHAAKPAAGDDFYTYVNGDWLATFNLPPDKASVGAAEDLMEQSDRDVRTMIEAIAATHPRPGTIEQKIADLYAAVMDTQTIEARGTAPLQPFFARIRAVETRDELTRLMGVIGYNSPIGAGVAPSPADPARNAVWVSQAGLGMPHRGYYLDMAPEMYQLQGAYRSYIARILKLIGYPDPEGGAKRIYALEQKIAVAHTDEDRSLSAKESMRTATMQELKAYAPEFDWDLYLGEGGFTDAKAFVVTDQTAVADLAKLVRSEPLDDWKLWMEFHIANSFAPYLPKAFADANFDFFQRKLSGVADPPERWQFAVGVVNEQMGDAVAKLYVERYFPADGKKRIDSIVANIRTAFENRMKALDWMDQPTRAAALDKLSALTGMIGYPDVWRDYSNYMIAPGKLIEDLYAGYEFEWREQLADLHLPVDRTRWPTAAHVVNAFYNPLGNTFVLPAGILKPPFFDPDGDPAANYGGIGAVIGHEMSHGFDDQGRQFDSDGRTANWWTSATDARFRARADRLIEQYESYCPYKDACVNGLGTLGENIGDLSGLEIAYAAYQLSLKGKPAPEIDGVTGDQRFFIAYARTYRDKVRDQLARALLEGDSHSPSRYRVNGVVRNMDAWYRAFHIKPTDKLYLAPKDRVSIW